MGILIKSEPFASKLIAILLFSLFFNISFIQCESDQDPIIKVRGQVYFSLPQIYDDYTVVSQISMVPPATPNPIQPNLKPVAAKQTSPRFTAKQKPDYFVIQAADTDHQRTRYNFIKGKNIFTPVYINSQVLESTNQPNHYSKDLAKLSDTLKDQFNKNFQELKVLQKAKPTPKQSKPEIKVQQQKGIGPQTKVVSKQTLIEQASQDISSQIYKQFKSIQSLKDKNLRNSTNSQAEEQRFQNLQKLVGYIIIGLIICFAILKRVTKKPETTLPKTSQERTQLRLRDTADDEQDDQDESSQSDQ